MFRETEQDFGVFYEILEFASFFSLYLGLELGLQSTLISKMS